MSENNNNNVDAQAVINDLLRQLSDRNLEIAVLHARLAQEMAEGAKDAE